jgi:RNA polymerase sigma-70 factor (ECF subfamily)
LFIKARSGTKIPLVDRSSGVVHMTVVEVDSQCAAGDLALDSVRKILVDLFPVLREVARGLGGSDAEVEDLIQDAFEKALRSIEKVDLAKNPRGWMVTILHHLHIDRCRQSAQRLPHIPCDDIDILAPEPTVAPAWCEITPDELRSAATQLPDELRTAYVMFALEGRSYVDIADALGIPKATVGTRLLRARVQLKQILTANLGMEGP